MTPALWLSLLKSVPGWDAEAKAKAQVQVDWAARGKSAARVPSAVLEAADRDGRLFLGGEPERHVDDAVQLDASGCRPTLTWTVGTLPPASSSVNSNGIGLTELSARVR